MFGNQGQLIIFYIIIVMGYRWVVKGLGRGIHATTGIIAARTLKNPNPSGSCSDN